MIKDYEGNIIPKYPGIVGDGIADDTEALQEIIDNYKNIILPSGLHIKITEPIEIDTSESVLFDGGNSEIIISGDFNAFEITGSVVYPMTQSPSSLTAQIINDEGSFEFKNIKIRSDDNTKGTGVLISGCFKANVRDCYIHNVKTGIKVADRNRDLIIEGNQIYTCWNYGIHFEDGVNLHQINITGNHVSCCQKCIYFETPDSMANIQIVGNDIEVSNYPGNPLSEDDFECISIASGDVSDGILSEMTINGNTIQGHRRNNIMINIVGGTLRYVRHLSITGNLIMNAKSILMNLVKVMDTIVSSNIFDSAGTYAISMGTRVERMNIIGNTCKNSGGFIVGTGEMRKVIISANNSDTTIADPYNITGSVFSRSSITNNVIMGENTSVKVQPYDGVKAIVANNVSESGTYDLKAFVTANNNV